MAEKTHWKVLIDTNYFGAYCFNDKVTDVVVTIKDVSIKEIFNPRENAKENCLVLSFEEENVKGIDIKPFIINKTNCERIEKLYGTGYVEDWKGKRITLFKTNTKVAGETVDCVRIKLEVPAFEAKVPQYACSVCGKAISQKVYEAAIQKFGVAVCSKECAEKAQQNQATEEENN